MTSDKLKKRWPVLSTVALTFLVLVILGSFFPSGPIQLVQGKRAEAKDEANQMAIGCQSYKVEYSMLPDLSENYRLVKTLCGDNPRKIEFISLKPRQVSPNGEDVDPWGTPFRIVFFSNGSVIVISAGPDKIFGTPDDITNQ